MRFLNSPDSQLGCGDLKELCGRLRGEQMEQNNTAEQNSDGDIGDRRKKKRLSKF